MPGGAPGRADFGQMPGLAAAGGMGFQRAARGATEPGKGGGGLASKISAAFGQIGQAATACPAPPGGRPCRGAAGLQSGAGGTALRGGHSFFLAPGTGTYQELKLRARSPAPAWSGCAAPHGTESPPHKPEQAAGRGGEDTCVTVGTEATSPTMSGRRCRAALARGPRFPLTETRRTANLDTLGSAADAAAALWLGGTVPLSSDCGGPPP